MHEGKGSWSVGLLKRLVFQFSNADWNFIPRRFTSLARELLALSRFWRNRAQRGSCCHPKISSTVPAFFVLWEKQTENTETSIYASKQGNRMKRAAEQQRREHFRLTTTVTRTTETSSFFFFFPLTRLYLRANCSSLFSEIIAPILLVDLRRLDRPFK